MKIRHITYATLLVSCLFNASVAQARPYAPKAGVCYYFQGEKLQYQRPCSIQSGYGTGSHYAILTWTNGHETGIILYTICPSQKEGNSEEMFCNYEVYGKAARRLWLSPFMDLSRTPLQGIDLAGNCYQIIASHETFCHSL